MNKDALIKEYEESGLTIIDFHLGIRLAKPMFMNTIMAILIFSSYCIFLYTIYSLILEPDNQEGIIFGLVGIVIVFIANILKKIISYLYVFSFLGLSSYVFISMNSSSVSIPVIDQLLATPIFMTIFFSVFFIALISTIIVYRTNRNITMKDGFISIPSSDVEQSIFAYIMLKPFWGLFYRRNISLREIVSVKNDGYGNKKEDIYPITISDVYSSNRLIFTSRQKRDEFKSKVSLLLGLAHSGGSSFGESE